jgi:DNA-binding protein HU-beta
VSAIRAGGPKFLSRAACICSAIGKLSAHHGETPLIRVRAKERNRPMTKNELISAVADKAQLTKTAAASAVDATFEAITATLRKGGEVKIMGFGNFRVVKRAAREGRDPRTGAPVKIKAAKRPRFSAGKMLKEAVNR